MIYFIYLLCLKEYYQVTTLYKFCMKGWYMKELAFQLFVLSLCFEADHVHSCVVKASVRVIGLVLQTPAVQINKQISLWIREVQLKLVIVFINSILRGRLDYTLFRVVTFSHSESKH